MSANDPNNNKASLLGMLGLFRPQNTQTIKKQEELKHMDINPTSHTTPPNHSTSGGGLAELAALAPLTLSASAHGKQDLHIDSTDATPSTPSSTPTFTH